MLTEAIEVMKYVRASAGRAGLQVVFEDVNQPRHDGKTIFLPHITAKTTKEQLVMFMASVDHEVAHDRFSSFKVLEDYKPAGLLMFVWNFLEDSRVNNIEAREYRGFRNNWDESSAPLLKDIMVKALKASTFMGKLTAAMIYWETKLVAEIFPLSDLATTGFAPDKGVLDVLNSFSGRLLGCHTTLDKEIGSFSTYSLAVDILKKLSKEVEYAKKPISKPGKGEEEDASGEEQGEKEQPELFDDEEGGEAKESSKIGAGEEDDEDDKEYKIIKIEVSKEDVEKFSVTAPREHGKLRKIGINHAPIPGAGGRWNVSNLDEFFVVNYPKKEGESRFLTGESFQKTAFKKDYARLVGSKIATSENFAQQVRRLIQIRAKVQTQYGTRKGKLDQSRLSRICFDAPGFNEKVFKTRIENKTLDAAISVLVDMSGSMGGEKAYNALASTLLLNEVCSTLNIPVEIVGFTDFGPNPVMFIYKGFSDLRVSNDDIVNSFATSSLWMSGNPDGENILWAHNRLIKRKEKKRLLIVMSDGQPAASKGLHGIQEFTRKVIDEIEQAREIEIYGLGLLSDSVRVYYKAHDVVNNPQEIPTKLISLIEKKILL